MQFFASNIDAMIPLLGGAYCTYLAFRGVPAGSPKEAEWVQWYATWGRMLKFGGPILMLFGLASLIGKLAA